MGFAGAKRFGRIATLALVYFATARFGLSFATVGQSVTLIWPPTGIAIACLTLWGLELGPGVALGAFAVNVLTPGVPLSSAIGMAAGNTIEALVCAHLLRRTGFSPKLERIQDVFRLIGFSAAGTIASATMGTLSLYGGGVIPKASLGTVWRVWWLGDLMGALLVAPLVLTYASMPFPKPPWRRTAEASVLFLLIAVVGFLTFAEPRISPVIEYPQVYVLFPLLIWAALRFSMRGAASANFIVVAMSVWATLRGLGPFARSSLSESLLFLNTFMAIVVPSSLVLGAAVAERNRAIQIREEFLSIASHELRTPLTTIQMHVDRLKRSGLGNQRVSPEIVASLNRQIKRLTGLVDELLDLTRIEGNRLALESAPVDLSALVRSAIDDLANESAVAGSRIDFRTEGPVVGHWDRARIEQVVSNLLTNSIKYGAGKPVTVALSQVDDKVMLVVSDQGIGIARHEQGRIFERLERAVSHRSYAGLGLGLYIARRIVREHGGAIRVESKLGFGARFIVELPLGSS
jgi:signal transduction histidine kinase